MLVFFFQAEDGIRDRTVTGVQTCALPIWLRDEADLRLVRGRDGISDGDERMVPPPWHAGGMEGFLVRSEGSPLLLHREGRSEERREGKSVDMGGGSNIKKKAEVNREWGWM